MKGPAALVGFLGIVGTLVATYMIPNPYVRYPVFGVSLVLALAAAFWLLASLLDIRYAVPNLIALKRLGVRRVYVDGSSGNDFVRQAVMGAKSVRLLVVSGDALIKILKNELVHALGEQSASVRVLLASSRTQFTGDIEEVEGETRKGHISDEIARVDALLREYHSEAKLRSGQRAVVGLVEVGHYSTHLRNSILLCGDTHGWLTLNLPPSRAVQSPSFELVNANEGLLTLCSKHFDRIWAIINSRGEVRQIGDQVTAAEDLQQAPRP